MSSEDRKEPIFDCPLADEVELAPNLGQDRIFMPKAQDPFLFDEESPSDAAGILMRCGMIVAVTLATFGGYQYHQAGYVDAQFASQKRTDWAGRPLAINNDGDLVWPDTENMPRNIDLTTTASIQSKPEPRVIEAIPVPIGNKISKNAKFHIVESGDTLSAISRTYDVSTADIMEINAIENPRLIKPGMKLYITR